MKVGVWFSILLHISTEKTLKKLLNENEIALFLQSLLLIPIHPIKRRKDEDEKENPGSNASNDGEEAEGNGRCLT